MLGVASFRKRIQVELADRAHAGKIKLSRGTAGRAQCRLVRRPSIKQPAIRSRPRSQGGRLPYLDYYAWNLSRLTGFPRCELYWPIAERDKAIAECKAFLTKYGHRFKHSPASKVMDPWHRNMGHT